MSEDFTIKPELNRVAFIGREKITASEAVELIEKRLLEMATMYADEDSGIRSNDTITQQCAYTLISMALINFRFWLQEFKRQL